MKNIFLIIISILGFHLAKGQEIPTYTSFNLVQYPKGTRFNEPAYYTDTASLKPMERLSFKTRRIPLAFREEFDPFTLKREVFKEKIGSDSITVEIQYERFDTLEHKIDYSYRLIDGESVFGYTTFSYWELVNRSNNWSYFLKSILIKSNGETLAFIASVKHFFFNVRVGSKIVDYSGVAVEKLTDDSDFYHIDFTGACEAFILFNTNTKVIYSYVEDPFYGFRATGKDIFSATTGLQYLIGHHVTLNAFEVGFMCDWCRIPVYTNEILKKHADQCKTVNLSSIIRNEGVGNMEGKPFSMDITDVMKDKNNPLLYHITGLSYHLLQKARHFEGDLQIKYVMQGVYATNITGELALREDKVVKESGAYTGAFRITVFGEGQDLSKQLSNEPRMEIFYNGTYKQYGANTFKIFRCGNVLDQSKNLSNDGRD